MNMLQAITWRSEIVVRSSKLSTFVDTVQLIKKQLVMRHMICNFITRYTCRERTLMLYLNRIEYSIRWGDTIGTPSSDNTVLWFPPCVLQHCPILFPFGINTCPDHLISLFVKISCSVSYSPICSATILCISTLGVRTYDVIHPQQSSLAIVFLYQDAILQKCVEAP